MGIRQGMLLFGIGVSLLTEITKDKSEILFKNNALQYFFFFFLWDIALQYFLILIFPKSPNLTLPYWSTVTAP